MCHTSHAQKEKLVNVTMIQIFEPCYTPPSMFDKIEIQDPILEIV
jgi:hypothetical protein